MSDVRTIAVLGAGTMGHGIAHAAMSAGYETALFDVSETALAKARAQIESVLKKSVELGKLAVADVDPTMARLRTGTEVGGVVAGCDLVIEAAPERIDLKLDLMSKIDQHAPKHAVIATNTSALSITEMAGAVADPSRVAGITAKLTLACTGIRPASQLA